jgi:hypothetical protein
VGRHNIQTKLIHSKEQYYSSALFLINHNMVVNKSMMANRCTSFAGHFDGHADQGVQCRAHSAARDAIRCHHWVSIRPLSPRQTPWSSILAQKIELWHCEIAVQKLAFKRHKMDPPPSSSSIKLCRKVEHQDQSQRAQLSF